MLPDEVDVLERKDVSVAIPSVNFRRISDMEYPACFAGAKPISITAVSSTQVFVLYDDGVIKRVSIYGDEEDCP